MKNIKKILFVHIFVALLLIRPAFSNSLVKLLKTGFFFLVLG